MIRNFRDRTTEAVFKGESPKGFPSDLVKVARRKLGYLDAAPICATCGCRRATGLKHSAEDRQGQHSIRINDQFRICFKMDAGRPDRR